MSISQQVLQQHDVALYVHYPFCVKKCPYCDFASIALGNDTFRDEQYIDALISEFKLKKHLLSDRQLVSVYIGGGTPSLCKAKTWEKLLKEIAPFLAKSAEISLEANPGTVSLQSLQKLRAVGFNRISIGVQSFNNKLLKSLGRIHSKDEAVLACIHARKAGFTNFNIDLMHGLPQQDVALALEDLKQAFALDSTHLSWYELTLEEGTYFGDNPPPLPDEECLSEIEEKGFTLLDNEGFEHYEISGFNRNGQYRCIHNQNYWLFGDYLGIGAAAHQKISILNQQFLQKLEQLNIHNSHLDFFKQDTLNQIPLNLLYQDNFSAKELLNRVNIKHKIEQGLYKVYRSNNSENLAQYFSDVISAQQDHSGILSSREVLPQQIPFEFMLNRLRLHNDPVYDFEYRLHTGYSSKDNPFIQKKLKLLAQKELIKQNQIHQDSIVHEAFVLTKLGQLMLNDIIYEFLEE